MLSLPRSLGIGIGACAPMVSKRVFEHATRRLGGAILAPGQRTVTAVLRVMGPGHAGHVQHDHRVLRRARWPALRGGRLLRQRLWRAVVPTGPVGLGSAEPMARRRGAPMAATGLERAPGRASPPPLVQARGRRGIRLMLLAPLPWAARSGARPWLTVLSPAARSDPPGGRPPQPLWDRARQAVWLGRRWRPARERVVVGAHPDAALAWREAVQHAGGGSTRVRRAAALYEPAPPRTSKPHGRPRQTGMRLPTRAKIWPSARTRGKTVARAHGDGDGARQVQITASTAVGDHASTPVVPRRWVLRRAPQGRFAPQAVLTTTQHLTPAPSLP
jgi:hypothetical protein